MHVFLISLRVVLVGWEISTDILFQDWENDCVCGKRVQGTGVHIRDPWIVNIYENNTVEETMFPLCLGSLISHHHLLTSRLCFGTVDIRGSFSFKIPVEQILKVVTVMLGSDRWFPKPHFPHSTALAPDLFRLKLAQIIVTSIIDIKANQEDDFCILTMKDYIDFSTTIAPLCLPTNPSNFYNKDGEVQEVEIYGYGLDNEVPDEILKHANNEKRSNAMQEDNIGQIKQVFTPLISRMNCLKQFGDWITGKILGKAHEYLRVYENPVPMDLLM